MTLIQYQNVRKGFSKPIRSTETRSRCSVLHLRQEYENVMQPGGQGGGPFSSLSLFSQSGLPSIAAVDVAPTVAMSLIQSDLSVEY